jgi:hypothetical protein
MNILHAVLTAIRLVNLLKAPVLGLLFAEQFTKFVKWTKWQWDDKLLEHLRNTATNLPPELAEALAWAAENVDNKHDAFRRLYTSLRALPKEQRNQAYLELATKTAIYLSDGKISDAELQELIQHVYDYTPNRLLKPA